MNDKCRMASAAAVLMGALIVANSIDHMHDQPLIPGAAWSASMHAPPAPNAEATLCEVRCPGYVEPLDGPTTLAEAQAMAASQHTAAGYWAGQKGGKAQGIPTNGVVTVYVAAPVTASQQTGAQPKQGKAASTKAPKQQSSGSKAGKAPAAPKRPRSQKQSQPSTTTTQKQSTTTKANGTTTTSTTTTTKRTG